MVVTCDHCGARYRLDEGRITGSGARITCPKCQHVFVVHQEVEALPPLDVHQLDFRSVGIRAWKVKVAIGLVYDFSDFRTLQKYIKEGRVTSKDDLSHDGDTWMQIGSIVDLEQHFIGVYRAAAAAQTSEAPAEGVAPEGDDTEALADALMEAETDGSELEIDMEPADEPAPSVEVDAGQIADDLLAAVEAASAAEDAAIDLDMDALLEDKAKSGRPVAVRRGSEQAAIKGVATTGNPEAAEHQFVDPFEALKKQRGVRSRGKSGASRKKRANVTADALARKKQRLMMVAVVVLGLGYALMELVPDSSQSGVPQAALQRQAVLAEAIAKKRAESVRQRMKEDLNAALKIVDGEEVEAFRVVDEPLVALVPADVQGRGAGGRPLPPGTMPPGSGGPEYGGGVEQRASSPRDLVALGNTAARRGQWAQASSAYQQALTMEPSNVEARALYGRALYKQGQQVSAEEHLRRAASGGSSMAHKILGHMAREQGDDSGAVAHYQTYLRSGPSDSASIEALIRQITN